MGKIQVEIVVQEEEVPEKLNDACIILAKLRHYEKKWHKHFGSANRLNLKIWQDKADKFLQGLNVVVTPIEEKE